MAHPLISVKNLEVTFTSQGKKLKAVDNVSFDINEGEIFALVGESGCGKSTTAFSLLRLIRKPGEISGGQVLFGGKDLLKVSEKDMCDVRGKEIGMIFQNPLDSLNPVYSIGWQIAEGLRRDNIPKKEAFKKTVSILQDVRIPDPAQRVKNFPHEISGGMRQRIMIGMMLSRNPKLLIADEPTTALDVTIQAQVLDLLLDLRKKRNTAILIITHDFGIVAEMADRVAIMYAGHIVEVGTVYQIFHNPMHSYTRLLMSSLPRIRKSEGRLATIPGSVPNLENLPPGCAFHVRCPDAREGCKSTAPALVEVEPGHLCACIQEGA